MFKVGDEVVFLSRKSDDTDLYTLEAVLDDGQFLGISDYRKAFPSSSFRHATPEEIAAGHRIDHFVDINDIGDDTHIENHISPNCKVGVK